MLDLLRDYLAVNTSHPTPDYAAVVELFRAHAERDGFEFKQITLPSGRPVIIITLQGSSSLPSLALNHHMDVVPAQDRTQWTLEPFRGVVDQGRIYGRGTQDCKGLGVVQYGALQLLKRTIGVPERTIHLLMVPDEEIGGFTGAKELVDHPAFGSLAIGYLLDEGIPSGNPDELCIKVDERTPIQIRVTSRGPSGHASGLFHPNCVHALIDFLSSAVSFQRSQREQSEGKQAGSYISMHITGLDVDTRSLNVIPSRASACIDVRVPSGISMDEGIGIIEGLVSAHPGISYEILATSVERLQPIDSESSFFRLVENALEAHAIRSRPFAFEATTDSRFYSSRGIQTLGLTPFVSVPNLHGIDESITVDEFYKGILVMYTIISRFNDSQLKEIV